MTPSAPAVGALFGFAFAVLAGGARAQDDGPRVYLLQPKGAQAVTAFSVIKRGNETPEPGEIIAGSTIDTDTFVLRYTRTFSVAGRQLAPFINFPMGEVRSTRTQDGRSTTTSSSGLGDLQIGGVLGLLGSPALPKQDFPAFSPTGSLGLLGRVYLPTGAYSSEQSVNLGADRFAYQLALPTAVVLGQSYRSPELTVFEVFPSVTFYQPNRDPFGARKVGKKALFSLETHLSHNFTPKFWASFDTLFRQGGETVTDGVDDGNPIQGWAAGGTGAVVFRRASLILTFEHSVERNDNGPEGWFFRTALVAPF